MAICEMNPLVLQSDTKMESNYKGPCMLNSKSAQRAGIVESNSMPWRFHDVLRTNLWELQISTSAVKLCVLSPLGYA